MPSCGLVKNAWPGFHRLPLDLGSPRSGGGLGVEVNDSGML